MTCNTIKTKMVNSHLQPMTWPGRKYFFFQVWAGFERPVCNAYYAYYALLCWLLLIVWRGTICMVKATNRETNSRWLDSGKSILKIRVLFSWLIIPGQSKSGRARLGLFCTELKVGLTSNIISNPSFTLVSTKFDFLPKSPSVADGNHLNKQQDHHRKRQQHHQQGYDRPLCCHQSIQRQSSQRAQRRKVSDQARQASSRASQHSCKCDRFEIVQRKL